MRAQVFRLSDSIYLFVNNFKCHNQKVTLQFFSHDFVFFSYIYKCKNIFYYIDLNHCNYNNADLNLIQF